MTETPQDKAIRLRGEIADGGRMREMLAGPVGQALDGLEELATNLWKRTEWADRESREQQYLFVRAIHSLRVVLTRVVEDGKLAETELTAVLKARQQSAMGG